MGFADKLRSIFQPSRLNVSERYEVLREAIPGTMSRFYVVRDRRTDDVVGLKICDREKRDLFEGRFMGLEKPTEGEIGLGMDHPHVITTIEHGYTTADEYYVLLEYLDGPGLNVFINQESPLLAANRLTLIRQMAEALAHVHEAGYIHRDVCPRNFICTRDASSVKLIDFGLTVPATKEYMQPGNRTGTPSYMAPEVVRRRKTDQRLDIFAFGTTVYHMCAFELPWPGQDVTGKAAMSHDTKQPQPILEFRPRMDPALADTIMACLSVDRAQRPPTMEDFLRRIRKVKSAEV